MNHKEQKEGIVSKVLRRLSLIEIFIHDAKTPLSEASFCDGKISAEVPAIQDMVLRNPNIADTQRGNLSQKQ